MFLKKKANNNEYYNLQAVNESMSMTNLPIIERLGFVALSS